MARIRHSILFLIGFAALMSIQNVSGAAAESSAPYIYYYANTINAIVVERADGTDSRIIAPGAMHTDSSVINNLDWSPSGEWMAWIAGAYNAEGGMVWYSGWIARSDGSERLTLLNNLGGPVIKMQWSPTRDLLFVAYIHELKVTLIIIDPAANKIAAQFDYESLSPIWQEGFPSGWLTTGDGVYFVLPVEGSSLLGILYADNRVRMQSFEPWNKQRTLIDIFNGRLLSYDASYFVISTRLTMRDLGSGKQVLIDSLPLDTLEKSRQEFSVEWDATMRYALIYYWQCQPDDYCYAGNRTQVYLLDWEKGTLQFLAGQIIPGGDFDQQIINYQPPSAVWSPDGRYAVLRDALKHVLVVEAASGQLFSINVPNVLAWQWAEKADALVLESSNEKQLYRYDFSQQKLSPFPAAAALDRFSWFRLSPDGRFMGMIRNALDGYDIVDLRTQTKRRWPHHSLGSSAGPIIAYVWDKSSRWFMTGEYTTFAGGGPGQSAVTVFNTAGTVRREISFCGYVGTCAGFVPDRALSHLGEGSLKSVIPEPEYTLSHSDKVLGVTWSPDGSQLASYTLNAEFDTGGKLHIWDMSGTPQLISNYPVDLYCIPHPDACHLAWSADNTTVTIDDGKIFETWDIRTGKQIEKHELAYFRPVVDGNLTSLFTSPDGNFAAYTTQSKPGITLVDTARNLAVGIFDQPLGVVGWSGDSQTLFLANSGGGSGQLLLWKAGKTQTLDAPYSVYSADVRPAGKYIFGASMYHRIYVWDAETGQRLDDLNFYARTVALSPDGTRLAAAGSSLVTIWDVTDLK